MPTNIPKGNIKKGKFKENHISFIFLGFFFFILFFFFFFFKNLLSENSMKIEYKHEGVKIIHLYLEKTLKVNNFVLYIFFLLLLLLLYLFLMKVWLKIGFLHVWKLFVFLNHFFLLFRVFGCQESKGKYYILSLIHISCWKVFKIDIL